MLGLKKGRSQGFYMRDNRKYKRFDIGHGTYGSPTVRAWGDCHLVIGKYCSIADNVTILVGGEHNTRFVSTYPFNVLHEKARHIKGHPVSKGNVNIGNDVWIGTEAMILSGVTIGSGAVIGARSVVTKDVKPYSIVGGNPARHLRDRFDGDVIDALLEIAWWDWPKDKIEAEIPALLNEDVRGFIAKHSKGNNK